MGLPMGTLLIIEDDLTTRDALTAVLEKEGRGILTAADGQEALHRLMNAPRPSLILLDLSMPGMNGWQFLHRQSLDPWIAGIPTIVLSAATSELPAGARQLLSKPVDAGRLKALVDQYC
jgi:CheY-like chemotaxis protein